MVIFLPGEGTGRAISLVHPLEPSGRMCTAGGLCPEKPGGESLWSRCPLGLHKAHACCTLTHPWPGQRRRLSRSPPSRCRSSFPGPYLPPWAVARMELD